MTRASLNRVPGRLAFNGVSFYSKGGTTIDTDLVYSQEKVGVAGLGDIDNRDKEAYDEISLTPDGRISPAIAAVAWPYGNPVIGHGIFADMDVPCTVHGNDNSKDTHPACAVLTMPQMFFHPTKTLIGQIKLLALRASGKNWSDENSLRKFEDAGGVFGDTDFKLSEIITQDYKLTWGDVDGWAGMNFYDGLTFEPKVEFVDDNVAAHGLFNKRIKSVGGMLRGIPIGRTRTQIDAQLKLQGDGAARGSSGAAKARVVTVTGADGKVYLQLSLAQLVKSKIQNGVEQLREGEVAWDCLPSFDAGARGAYFTTPIA